MANPEKSIQAFDKERKRHLDNTRRLRRQAMVDERLDMLTRGVLGTTGSEQLLNKLRDTVSFLGSIVGEAIITFNMRGEDLRSSEGGIISGLPEAEFHGYSDTPLGSGSSAFWIKVPINHPTSAHHWAEGHVYTGPSSGLSGHSTVEVVKILNHEWENPTLDPDKDFWVTDLDSEGILAGKLAIYRSPLLAAHLHRTLIAIEEQATDQT